MPLIQQLSNLLLQGNKGQLQKKEFYKLRTKVYQLIAFVYMDDQFDNYVRSIDQILQQITFNQQNCQKDEMIKFFYDASGLAQNIDVGNIYRVFLKKTYNLYKFIYSENLLRFGLDQELMIPGLKLLTNLIDNKTQRITILNNQNYGYLMFRDFSVFLNKYGSFLLEQFSKELVNNNNIKLVLLYWRILNKFITSKLIKFSVFQLFGDSSFINYLQINLDLKFSLFNYVFQYPKLAQVFLSNLLLISEQFLETVFSFMNQSYTINIFAICKEFLLKITQENFKYGSLSMFQDDTLITNTSQIIQNLCVFCVEEINIKLCDDIDKNVQQVYAQGQPLFKEYIQME
ncbi:hypothetical protein IMG5_201900 [Ichthyophthirius multifiliis]|uniref:Uncharacterized protein n=1 Tax=Ichthyophthirius multifiliis TaxID=5932 RepID=G0R607_ICHMU|nr:hypothetical protein IMG5_201900 [Ichthyophthirius multifiliis]EGR27073.1 hypothetical protein IMG5_201900 [Ichthyophthirius multifiliis]|eukprot:XP_004023957.1 hypothetical protein IMG5_201900 [Ichthyophthirius multifiliis]